MVGLTVVMYHYVRPIVDSAYPGINGLELQSFKNQLDYIEKHFTVISVGDVVRYAEQGGSLPNNPLLLTFDDGYRDHAQFVFPELIARKLKGVFFPPANPIENRQILDVNKIHYFLSQAKDRSEIISTIESAVLEHAGRPGIDSLVDLRRRFLVPNRFDPADVNFIKRLLQFALPMPLRSELCDLFFRRYVSEDPIGFADEIYLRKDDLIRMIDGGMEIGSHGNQHFWMDQLSEAQQLAEIDGSLNFLSRLGMDKPGFYFCFPYGAYNEVTLRLLQSRQCAAAFTTKSERFNLAKGSGLMEISRFDTNDLKCET